ncbi:SGNH/GDSL hydrolase family protein [Herbiconiux daphne]|uniref:SGNH/GDSL hydrolase family protein n=1 Tax=Herbiconiux daphne TaxID=2970914 RepID=A0ABT2H6N2_9MICO|nr:SGNH/GDSL hydrolase family protein [Herbiconiux daphne]MCS5735584.1 SGNH/GDSL hydrolase family protein [Herbiconiux daphne]
MPKKARRPGSSWTVEVAVLSAALVIVAIAGAVFLGVSISRNSSSASEVPSAPTASTKVVFIGDSYTHGTGASSEANRWTSIVSKAKGWSETNLGRGGTGYVTTSGINGCGLEYCPTYDEMIPTALESQPDIVVVAGGQNDMGAWTASPSDVTAGISKTYGDIRGRFPDARIIAVGPSTVGAVSNEVVAFDEAVQSAAASVNAEYISLIDPPVIEPSWVTVDGGHVTDSGHAAIAQRVLAAIG